MPLNQRQIDQLWGENGPYSQVQLIVETRILDDKVTRTFVNVETDVNPFTFEYIKKNRKKFADDQKIQQLLDHSDYRGLGFGYVSMAYSEQLDNHGSSLAGAQMAVDRCKETIIKMHKFVMDNVELPPRPAVL
jgi:hypothetical protein